MASAASPRQIGKEDPGQLFMDGKLARGYQEKVFLSPSDTDRLAYFF